MSWVDICTLYKFSKVYEHTKLQGYSKVEFFFNINTDTGKDNS